MPARPNKQSVGISSWTVLTNNDRVARGRVDASRRGRPGLALGQRKSEVALNGNTTKALGLTIKETLLANASQKLNNRALYMAHV
jgi:hypothetical protein